MRMRMKWVRRLLITLAILVPTFAAAYFYGEYSDAKSKPVVLKQEIKEEPLDADVIFTLVNEERVKAGVKPFIRDTRLDATARSKANSLFNTRVFSHVDPDGKHGYEYMNGIPECHPPSENLSMGALNSKRVVRYEDGGWMFSKPHREAMLSPNFTLVGYAVAGRYVVQHMC